MVDATNNFRSPMLEEPNLMPPTNIGGAGGATTSIGTNGLLRTPYAGNVRALAPPPLPPLPLQTQQYGAALGGGYAGYGSYGYNAGYGGFGTAYGGFGNNFGYYGGAYNRFGGMPAMNPIDPEFRFIQLAEACSRPAFQSIESLVSAFGNIASMLDSTFFALTSSFRAILGVAANFGRLRGVFAQFWQTFAIFRALTWIYKKILYWLRISDLDPSSEAFKKAYIEAVNETSTQQGAPKLPRKGQSPWPVVAFLSFIITAPYLIMKLLGTVTKTAQEEARNPKKWIQPIDTVALYDFYARNPTELSITAGQRVIIAPKEIQNTQDLLNTGWALATVDGLVSGIVPINYVKTPQQLRQERKQNQLNEQQQQQQQHLLKPTISSDHKPTVNAVAPQSESINLSSSAFAAPPVPNTNEGSLSDLGKAPQPLGPSSIADMAFDNFQGM